MDRRQQTRASRLARPSSRARRAPWIPHPPGASGLDRASCPGGAPGADGCRPSPDPSRSEAWLDAGVRLPSGSASIGPLLRTLGALLAGALAVAGLPGAATAAPSGARRVLRNTLLQTTYPASWRARLDHLVVGGQRITEYSLSSTGAPLNADAIPSAGGIGITVYVYPERTERTLTRRIRLSGDLGVAAAQLIELGVVGIPRAAQYVTNIAPLRLATLGGRGAARVTYLYEYGDDYNLNLQDDVVALRGHTIVQVELDAAPSLQVRAESAFRTLLDAWRWRAGTATMAT